MPDFGDCLRETMNRTAVKVIWIQVKAKVM